MAQQDSRADPCQGQQYCCALTRHGIPATLPLFSLPRQMSDHSQIVSMKGLMRSTSSTLITLLELKSSRRLNLVSPRAESMTGLNLSTSVTLTRCLLSIAHIQASS